MTTRKDAGRSQLRRGEKASARRLLAQAVMADPGDAEAWLLLARALDDPVRRRHCMERAMALGGPSSERVPAPAPVAATVAAASTSGDRRPGRAPADTLAMALLAAGVAALGAWLIWSSLRRARVC